MSEGREGGPAASRKKWWTLRPTCFFLKTGCGVRAQGAGGGLRQDSQGPFQLCGCTVNSHNPYGHLFFFCCLFAVPRYLGILETESVGKFHSENIPEWR